MTSRRSDDLLLLHLIDTAGLCIQRTQVIHIVGCQSKDQTILAGIDDRRRFSCNFLAAHKVLDILGDHDLHTVVLTDTLC